MTARGSCTQGRALWRVLVLLLVLVSPSRILAAGDAHAPEWPNLLSDAGRRAAMALPVSSPWHLEPTLADLEDRQPQERADAKAIYERWIAAAGTPANVRANDPTGDQTSTAETQSECAVAARGSNVVVAWNDSKGLRVAGVTVTSYAYSTDGGATFTDGGNVPLITAGDQSYGDCTLDVDASGNFYLGVIYLTSLGSQDVAVYRGTFSGASFSWNAPVIASIGALDALDKPYLCVDPATGNVYVSYTRFTTTTNIEVVRGTALGTTWSAAVVLETSATTSGLQGSRPFVGPEGYLYVCYQAQWGSVFCDLSSPTGQIKLRRSTNPAGAFTFGAAVVVGTVQANWMSYWAGNLRSNALFFPDIAVDRSGGPSNGNVYVTWNEAVPWTANAASGTSTAETESNDAANSANVKTINPGDNATGNILTTGDFDYWKINVTTGQHLMLRLEPQGFNCGVSSTTRNFQLRFYKGISGTAGDSILANSNLNQFASEIVFDAPETATYLFRVRNVNTAPSTTTGTYTVKTRTLVYGTPSPGRDMRDVVVARSTNLGLSFSTEVLANNDAANLDNCIPAIAVDNTGRVNVFFYDARDALGARILRSYYRAVSTDGGLTYATNQRVSNELNYFNLNTVAVPNYGEYNQACAAGSAVFASWSDERLSHAPVGQSGVDAYVAALRSCVSVACAADTVVGAGSGFSRRLCVTNCGSFADDFSYTITDSLGWCGGASGTLVSIPVGGTSCVTYACSVPGGTPPGTVNTLKLVASPASSPNLSATCRSRITVAAAAGLAVTCPPDTTVDPGASFVRHFGIDNTGATAGTYDYSVTDAAGWAAASGSVGIGPGGHADIPATVNVPGDAYGAADSLRFHVSLQGSVPLLADSCVTVVHVRRVSGVDYVPAQPRVVALLPNDPNPFNPSTRVTFEIPALARVDLDVFAADGRHVRSLLHGTELPIGRYIQTWNGKDDAGRGVASGVYVLRLRAGDQVRSQRAVLLK